MSGWTVVPEPQQQTQGWTPVPEAAPAKPASLWDAARAKAQGKSTLELANESQLGASDTAENLAGYLDTGPGDVGRGIADMAHGNIAKGGHTALAGAATTLAPVTPFVAAGAPASFLRATGGGYLTGKAAEAVTGAVGGDEDQQQFANDLGNLGGGAVAGSGAIRAFLESPTKALVAKAANATDGVVSDEILGMISPRALHGLRMLRAAAKAAGNAEDSAGLSEIASKHKTAISDLESKLNDALSKANALPPEGPTATLTDVPDLRVQPSQQPPQNLLESGKAAFQAAQRGAQGEFPVASAESVPALPPEPAKVTPNASIYDEVIPEKTAQQIYAEKFLQKSSPKPSLLDQLKQWDQIRQIHAQLEDQIGKGQDEIQDWIDAHDQKTSGASRPTAAQLAKQKFDAAKATAEATAKAVPGSDDIPTPKAKEASLNADTEQGGHAGGGVSSVEELSRPGTNYIVSKSGQLTYHGKSFAPESTPNGASHVTVMQDGKIRVNAGPELNPAQQKALNKALPPVGVSVRGKQGYTEPGVPESDDEMMDRLMQSIVNAKKKKSGY